MKYLFAAASALSLLSGCIVVPPQSGDANSTNNTSHYQNNNHQQVATSHATTSLHGAVYSPAQGVLCDRTSSFCADEYGIAVGHTQVYLGKNAEQRLMATIHSAGEGNFDFTSFTFSNGVHRETLARKCTVSKHNNQIDEAHTQSLFGR